MKNLSLGLNVLLVVAVATLFFLQFKGENNNVSKDNSAVVSKGASVVYINTDTLLAKYKMSIELNEAFLQKAEERRADLTLKAKAFEKEYVDFQKKLQNGAFLTEDRARQAASVIEQKKVSLDKLQQEMQENTMRERADMTKKLFDALTSFLEEYNKTQNYDVILSTSLGGTVLFSKNGLDITDNVVSELNSIYKVNTK